MVTNPKGGWDEGVVCLGRSDPQRTLFAITFRDENASYGMRSIRSLSQFGRQFVQPAVAAVRLNVLEGLAVDSRCTVVGPAAQVGEFQDVSSVHLVVQPVEPITGRFLRFGMQRRLEFLNLGGRYEAHANLPALALFVTLVLNSGPFPRPELPGVDGTASLSVTPASPACPSRESGGRSRASTDRGFPCCVGSPLQTCHRQYPGGTTGSRRFSGCDPQFPSDGGLPRFHGGSAPTLRLSRPAQRSLALRPACSRSRLRDPLHR